MMIIEPKVAILIVNFRRASDTIECLDSLLHVAEPSFDIFLTDNGSGINEVAQLSSYAASYTKRIYMIPFPENYGFSGAHNRLLEKIFQNYSYEFILLLNNDTVVKPDFLTKMLIKIDRKNNIEMVAARMMKYHQPTLVDNLGITFYKCGLASNRKSLDDPLLGPCGGCALYTTNLLSQIYQSTGEYFDDYFFCYAEDTDLAWRAILLGYHSAYADDAVIFHKGSISSGGPNSDFILYYGIRNSLFVLVKNIPTYLLLKNSIWIVMVHCAILLRYIMKKKCTIIWHLYRDFFLGIPTMKRKRSHIIKNIRITPNQVSLRVSNNFYDRTYLRDALKELFLKK